LRIKTYAKLNLYLKVFPLRPDGYHDVVSVMQTIDIADDVSIIRKDQELRIVCAHPAVPVDGRNTIAKVYRLLKEMYPAQVSGAEVRIAKHIPPRSGLGGGSGNAAGAIMAFRDLFNIPLDNPEMVRLSSRVGSDIPFMLTGGCAMVSGRGEIVERLPGVAGAFYLVVVPPVGVDTAKAYGLLDERRMKEAYKAGEPRGFYDEVRSAWLSSFATGGFEILMHNDFEEVIPDAYPEIAAAKNEFLKSGVPAYMTGSGSAVFATLDDYARALDIMETMRAIYGEAVYLCQPTDKGVEKID